MFIHRGERPQIEQVPLNARPMLDRAVGRYSPIFQIGFNRCGTCSLYRFLLESGIPSLHWSKEVLATRISARIHAGEDPIKDFPHNIGFTDMIALRPSGLAEPYKMFEYLHCWYPNALYILNTRDREKWIASRAGFQFEDRSLLEGYAEMLKIPRSAVPHFWRAEWDYHHAMVRAHFSGAPNFLEFHIEQDHPEKLRAFVATRYPRCLNTPFHITNQGSQVQASAFHPKLPS